MGFQVRGGAEPLSTLLAFMRFFTYFLKKKEEINKMLKNFFLNKPYLTDSYIVFTLIMESVSKNTMFGLKMMVKSGMEKIFLKFLHVGDNFSLLYSVQNHKFRNKNNHHSAWRDFKIFFLDHFSPSFLGQKLYFWIQIPFRG